ncbi:hypothetical protein [Mycolicibacterium komossense]|uniref:Uncharacterized protein n=1 Tax=Mycolicibacterium komossense TaxID=1779 RepID=A0ABT3CMW6_9MYCO|nr:hypothetical protein [Mycolicibacterium komossense]MCV7230863.1 hypothetical protein [Mycolicibacterium komossense]
MDLDYEDFESGGMALHNPSLFRRRHLAYEFYKHTPEFIAKQAPKPMYESRDPAKTELRVWETDHGHVNEVGGIRMYIGSCVDCDGLVMLTRDVSGPEFRGRGNRGWRGRWPSLCYDCRDRHKRESLESRRAAKRAYDRAAKKAKREEEREDKLMELQYEEWDRERLSYGNWGWVVDQHGNEQWVKLD